MRKVLHLRFSMKVRSFMRHAQEFTPVEVELSLTRGLPQISFLGLPDPFIRESVTRIKSALRAQGYEFPKAQQVLVQLRPSHLRKTSRGLDLAVAAALLWETEQAPKPENIDSLILYGELSLKGEVIVPDDIDDAEECLGERDVVVTGSEIQSFNGNVWTLNQLKDFPEKPTFRVLKRDEVICLRPQSPYRSFSKLQGDLISLLAAGGHTALMVGTPGSGKSATAECINCFLPTPDPDDWKAIRKVGSYFHRVPTWRPNVVVHHSITPLAMTGGGSQIRPGEITRAHGGTLIMDELLEFRNGVQDAIREPLESCEIEIARQGKHVRMPANFQLIATSNLCRCGNYVPRKLKNEEQSVSRCRCASYKLKLYLERFSGPILDRFAIIGLFFSEESRAEKVVGSKAITQNVMNATDLRLSRDQQKTNARLDYDEAIAALNCDSALIDLFTNEVNSRRTKLQIMQVARTLADLAGSEKTKHEHFNRASEWVVKSKQRLLGSLES